MTYKSIRELIRLQLGSRLQAWEPITLGAHTRALFLEAQLFEQATGGHDFAFGKVASTFDRFCSGKSITVGHGAEPSCFMKPLDPTSEEVWEIRVLDPRPQIRVFGRFAMPDVFIATHARRRDELGDPAQSRFKGNSWPTEIQRCKTIWNTLLQNHPPHTRSEIHDYISEGAVEVRKRP